MAEQSVLPAGASGRQNAAAIDGLSGVHPGTQDTTPQDELYKPLPPGCWTVPFHGNCPRCHHYHRAAQIQVKVTEDPSQVSHVRCEKCQEKWAAFGGVNTTRISLLSTATTEPDNLNRQVRYSLIQIVEMAVEAKASLEPVTELSSPALSRQPSEAASTSAAPWNPEVSTHPVVSVPSARDVVEVNHQQDESPEVTSEERSKLPKQHHRTIQLFSRLKIKMTTQLAKLRRAHLKLKVSFQQPVAYTRKPNPSPTRTPQTSTLNVDPINDTSATPQTRSVLSEDMPDAMELDQDIDDKPTGRLAEVITFIAGLDKDTLSSLDDQERAKWMRETYTNFKKRNQRTAGCSSTTETSNMSFSPPSAVQFDRRSYEVMYAGTHIEGLGDIRNSIAISEGTAEHLSNMDGSTVVSVAPSSVATLTQQTRPESGPQPTAADRSSTHSRRRSRRSLQISIHSRMGSSTSLRGHAGSRLSQGSMIYSGSMTNIPETSQHHDSRSPNPGPSSPRPMSS